MPAHHRSIPFLACCLTSLLTTAAAWAMPAGYRKHTVPLNAPPVGLAFDNSGVLYALENAGSGNATSIRVIQPDYSLGADLSIVGDDPENFYVGGMTYDPVTDSLLITDNTTDGRIYSITTAGVQQTLATGIPGISDVAVRSTGEIFVSTALGDNIGEVLQVDRSDGSTVAVATGLDFGAGLAFEPDGNLLVLEADANFGATPGRLHRLPIAEVSGNLQFSPLELLLGNMSSSAGLAVDSEGDLFSTGKGGLFSLEGSPLEETSFDSNGNPDQFAAAIEHDPGAAPFEPFAGPGGGRLAFLADFSGEDNSDAFVTLIEPLPPENANFDGNLLVDADDLTIWEQHYGTASGATQVTGDANGDHDTDAYDFLIWQRQFNASPAELASQTVPEPTSCLLMATLFVWVCGRRSRWGD